LGKTIEKEKAAKAAWRKSCMSGIVATARNEKQYQQHVISSGREKRNRGEEIK